ncbi:MAG: alpha-2-macroglobulin [Spirochaetaceae bacterium]|nr:alpha-2-macroglobulin [Spirochaetaceae bacterium]
MALALCLAGCTAAASTGNGGDPAPVTGTAVDSGLEYVSQEMIDEAFKLDFTPLAPERESLPDLLPADAGSDPDKQIFRIPGALGNSGGQAAGGGLRELADYKTEYINPEKEAARIAAIQEAQLRSARTAAVDAPDNASLSPLTVADWGPRGFFPSTVQRPSIYVVFSEPMVALAALGSRSAVSDMVTITPPLAGSFRWYGTSYLSFEAEEPCQAQQTYRITVNPRARSIYGKTISGETDFSFYTESLKISRIVPGEDFQKKNNIRYYGESEIPPEAAREISLYFNYPVTVRDLEGFLSVRTKGGEKTFTLTQAEPAKIILRINGGVEFDSYVNVVLKQGAKSANSTLGTSADSLQSFNTPGPFRVLRSERIPANGSYRNLVNVYFSARLKEAGAAGKVRTEPAMKLGADNIEISGTMLRVANLPVNYGDVFTLIVDPGIEDVYGRKTDAPYTVEIKVPDEPPPNGQVTFLNWERNSQKMLESRFDPRYLFEYRNVTDKSWYTLSSKANPFSVITSNTRRFTLNTETNRRWFADMDLKPYLKNGKHGFVFFDAGLELLTARYDSSKESFTTGVSSRISSLTLQVTDLGITVRTGFNKTAVLVTSLSTGKPVENARVRLISPKDIALNEDISQARSFAEGRTGPDGLALISLGSGVYAEETKDSRGYRESVYVHAEKDGDQAVFQPRDHNTWSFNVRNRPPQAAEQIEPVTFLFTDRGLYKPGEILTFRGVDRSLALGSYLIYRGKYTVVLETDSYRNSQTIALVEGETSEAGGFYGSITLPDDLTPQGYRLSYRRVKQAGGSDIESDASAETPVTVAFFERLKFEASITGPEETLYAGDVVNMTLKASYLSGGSLSGASYEESWYRSPAWFTPPSAEAKNYRFGPRDPWEGSRSLSSGSGTLGAGGVASLSQRSTESPVTGAAYYYSVDAWVTDLSNQMIAASRQAVVHPARFYLGVAAPSTRGFPKTGQELSFNFAAFRPSGEKAGPLDWDGRDGAGSGKMTVEFFRDEWHLVQQEGVAGYVYDRYVKETVNEGTQTLQLKNSGSFKFTPPTPGYYTVRVSAQDSGGRKALTEYGFYVTGGGGSGYWDMNLSNEIRLTPDGDMYNPGDTAQILLQSALPGGYYLVTVEREGIYSEELKYLDEGTTVLEIPIARNYVPAVYVSVASYSVRKGPPTHEYGSPDLDKPKGYYGVTALKVNPRVKAFTVAIEDAGNRIYRPGETVTLTLKAERNGQPLSGAELTLMAVDRGVLDLINYHVPDPVDYFYGSGRFPLAVMGGDSRSMLMDPVTYSIKNLQGGDSEDKLEERRDFNPTAVFEPMLKTGADGRVKTSFKLPDNLTTYRITVFGVRGDLFALKESEIAARNRINIKEALPRRLRERDTAEAGVLITNMDTAAHKVTVSLAVSPGSGTTAAGMIKPPGTALVDGPAERSVTLKAGENGVVYFDLAAVKEGYINCNFTIRSDILNERMVNELYIERPYVFETVTTLGTVADGASSAREALVIPGWADNGAGSLAVSLDATRLGLLDSAVSYLFHYPYGCLEQRSSAVLPLVIFGEYIDAFNLRSEVADPKKAAENEIKTWAQYQKSDGGFPYWPDGSSSNFYVSLRIAHIIALARQKNYALPPSINAEKLVSYLDGEFRKSFNWPVGNWNYSYRSYLQSYMLYVFSMLKQTVEPARLAEISARQDVDAGSLAFAGMTYRNLNRGNDAAAMGEKIRQLLRATTRGVDLTDPRENNSRFYHSYYGGKVEQLALVLEFFVQQYPGDQINGRILYSLLDLKRAGGFWDSTAATIRVLSAVDALIRTDKLDQVNVSGTISLEGNELFKDSYRGLGAKPSGKSFDFKGTPLAAMGRDTALPLDINRSGQGALYYTASLRYAIPAEIQSFRDEGLGVFVTLTDADTGKEVSGAALQSGKTYRARVTLSSGRDRTYVALRVPLPSGAEILDTTFVTTARYSEPEETGDYDYDRGYWNPRQPSNMTIMDNEIRYFWDSFDKGEVTTSFLFRASRRGVYPTPPPQAECMYEGEIFGRGRGLLYTIE